MCAMSFTDESPDPDETGAVDESWDMTPVEWTGDELEDAYQRALEALEASEVEIAADRPNELQPQTAAIVAGLHSSLPLENEAPIPVEDSSQPDDAPLPVNPRQILEGCLFVSPEPVSLRQLGTVFRDSFSAEYFRDEFELLNQLYVDENRPYRVVLVEGGYSLRLLDEYERVRDRVHGQGPKEVRLNQEALEVLALVAYRQPISQDEIQELGKPQCGGTLRQLVRRQLLAIERDAGDARRVLYRTTDRFLALFGLRSLKDLPRPELVELK
jgi:segregation and condensation protein B